MYTFPGFYDIARIFKYKMHNVFKSIGACCKFNMDRLT